MTSEQMLVKDFMLLAQQETPDKPTIPDIEIRRLRAKLILEEALETCRALGFILKNNELYSWEFDENNKMKTIQPDLVAIADGCEDIKVVVEGTLVACGLIDNTIAEIDDNGNDVLRDNDPLFDEVMESNFSKLWTINEYEEAKKAGVEDYIVTRIRTSDKEPFRDFLVKDKYGKVIKSVSYTPANLEPIIEEMRNQK